MGIGSPWHGASVAKGEASDPYLLTGYDKKTLKALADADTELDIEVDVDGTGLWVKYGAVRLVKGKELVKEFGDDLKGYWIRFKSSEPCKITVTLIYE